MANSDGILAWLEEWKAELGIDQDGLDANEWIAQIFRAQQARNGGIVRRKVEHVHRYASLELLEAEVKRRGFHMVKTGDQYVILCHRGDFRLIC